MNQSKTNSNWTWHVIAIVTIVVWAASFPCTKILLNNGVTPTEIFVYRTFIAYVGLLIASRFRVKLWGWRDEGLAMLLGLTGGTMYFVLQNFALDLTLLSDVVIVIAVNPLLTIMLSAIFLKEEHFSLKVVLGSVLAFLGVAVITLRNGLVWGDGLLGNLLAFLAALAWALYCVIFRGVQSRHGILDITRKVMIYGAVFALPVLFFVPTTPLSTLLRTDVVANIVFLGLICSMAAFFVWNMVIKKIGAIDSSNYLYLEPVLSMIIGAVWLGEPVGWIAVAGCAMVLLGVILVEKK